WGGSVSASNPRSTRCSSWVEKLLFFLICLGVCTRIAPQEPRLCRKFAFGMICAMVSLGDLQCTERESNDGDQLQGGPFPTRYHSHGCTLVCGVSLKLSACRRTTGGAGGTDRPRHYPALGREIQSPVGRGVPPAQAPGVGQLAHG